MTETRIMHVDDEPDIREVVRMSLGLDPDITVRSFATGAEALAAVGSWMPDLVLLDVMMPTMDGPTTLAKLHGEPRTANIPVVFMTARVQARELDHFKSLGAVGVLPKPFDPLTLAAATRQFLRPKPAGLDGLRDEFLVRAKSDAMELAQCRTRLAADAESFAGLARVRQIAHGLAGAGGIFGFSQISDCAAEVEDLVIIGAPAAHLQTAMDQLLARIAQSVAPQAEGARMAEGVRTAASH